MPGDKPEPRPESSYTSSYLAYQREHAPAERPKRKRRWQGPGKGLVVWILAAVALYYFRQPVVGFLEKFLGRGVMEAFGGAVGWKDEETGQLRPSGGVTTFSDGGTVTVSPDDGSDRYRVVVPPEGNP
jgi:hypothetical protein